MNINDFVTANAAMRYGRSAAASKIISAQNTVINTGLQKAAKRIQALADTHTAQLSYVSKDPARSIGSFNQRTTLLERQQRMLAALYQTTSPSQVYGSY